MNINLVDIRSTRCSEEGMLTGCLTTRRIHSGPQETGQQGGGERGAALLITAAGITVLLILFGIIGIIGFAQLVRTELQSVADSAAHAGTSVLCTSQQCWENAQLAAARIIAKQDTHVGPGGERLLQFNFDSSSGHSWTSSNSSLQVTIERGRWTSRYGFTSLEPMLAPNPDLIPYVAANAVRVKLTRSRLAPFLPGFLATEFPISVEATAVFEEMKPVCAAPFAIPYCSLLSKKRNYSKKRSEKRDRLFTSVNRHCPPGKICGNFPSFPLGPSDNEVISTDPITCTEPNEDRKIDADACEEVPATGCPAGSDKIERFGFDVPATLPDPNPLQFPMIEKIKSSVDKLPRFNTDRYDATIKNYGVFGLARSRAETQDLLRLEVRNYLDGITSAAGCVHDTTLGDEFKVLADGLRNQGNGQNDNLRIWNRITGATAGALVDAPATHPEYYKSGLGERAELFKVAGAREYTKGNVLEFNSYWGYCDLKRNTNPPQIDTQSIGCWWCPDNGIGHAISVPFDDDAANDNYGMCNSTRLTTALNRWMPDGSPIDTLLKRVLPPYDDPRTFLSPRNWNIDKLNERLLNEKRITPAEASLIAEAFGRVLLDIHFTRVWEVEVPVIMQRGGGPACELKDGDPETPADDAPVDPNMTWEVIGFAKMAFYDVDIGNPPPSVPRAESGAPLRFPISEGRSALVFPAHSEPNPHATPPPKGPPLKPHPYSFDENYGNGCNVVRGRIIEADSAIPRTNHEKRRTVLVD